MQPQTIPPTRMPAILHTTESQWRESANWNYDHRVSVNGRVLCIGQRTIVEHCASTGEKRKCPQCLQVTGPSAL
jgi:hypothetical protein